MVQKIKNLTNSTSKINGAANLWIDKSLLELSYQYKKLFKLNLNIYDQDYVSIFKALHKETDFTDLLLCICIILNSAFID